jgi:hypothetical protein
MATDLNPALRYVDASRLRSEAGRLAEADLRNIDNETIGSLDGVLIDPLERRLRFFVVQSSGWLGSKRYLIPTDCAAQVGADGRTLRLDMNDRDLSRCAEYESAAVEESQDDDLIASMFHQRIA